MTFTYEETRDSEQLRLLTPAIDAFISRYQNPLATTSTCPRQTLFFFPGGMASQLTRATKKFKDGVAAPQTFNYEPLWLTLDAFLFGGARELKMHRDSVGVFRDKSDRIIVADGAVNLFGCTPQDGFIDWCANNNVDLFIFTWDWRRRLDETVKFFVGTFLPFFKARVLAAGCPDPLASFSLVGHSFGGMIVNLILRGNDPIVANMMRAITVATPFYGYSGQVHRWFEGEAYLNGLFPPYPFKQGMMETIASLPGLYILHFLDEATYNDSTNQLALTTDPDFPLPSYPSMDATIANLRADPYNPQTNGSLVRYPGLTGFDRSELDYARLQFQQMAAPMAANVLQKFYNIRGVRTQSDQQTPISDTAGSVTWDWIPTSFNSTNPSPIVDSGSVPGDDTQPAWSARLVTNAPARCINVRASDVQHMFLMNHAQTLNAIASILCAPGAAMNSSVTTQPEPASDEDVVDFLRWLHKHRRRKTPWPRLDDKALFKVIPPEFREKLPAIARRIMMDIMKRPGPPALSGRAGGATGTKPPGPDRSRPKKPARKPTGRKPAAKRRQRGSAS